MEKLIQEDHQEWAKANSETLIHLGHSGFTILASEYDFYHFRESITLIGGTKLEYIIREFKKSLNK